MFLSIYQKNQKEKIENEKRWLHIKYYFFVCLFLLLLFFFFCVLHEVCNAVRRKNTSGNHAVCEYMHVCVCAFSAIQYDYEKLPNDNKIYNSYHLCKASSLLLQCQSPIEYVIARSARGTNWHSSMWSERYIIIIYIMCIIFYYYIGLGFGTRPNAMSIRKQPHIIDIIYE